MGLTVDKWFYDTLKGEEALARVEGRVYNTARTAADEEEDRVPYIIITHNGLVNEGLSKDGIEGEEDKVQIGILVVADDREGLASLTVAVRECVRKALREADGWMGIQFSAEPVQYDMTKPCYWQNLKYACVVEND